MHLGGVIDICWESIYYHTVVGRGVESDIFVSLLMNAVNSFSLLLLHLVSTRQ
jgi:hypothetical protein